MNTKIKTLLICIAIPLLVGGLSGFLTRDSMEMFSMINKPPLSPPGILFPIVWTVLYTFMGVASYLILTSNSSAGQIKEALFVYALQLGINFFWSIFFFNNEWYLFSFIWLLLLWSLILACILLFLLPTADNIISPTLGVPNLSFSSANNSSVINKSLSAIPSL